MYNQTCGCQNQFQQNTCNNQRCMNHYGQNTMYDNMYQGPQPVIAPKRVCISQQVTPVAQPVICPIECRRVNRCMYYPVFYPQYEQTCVNMPY